MRLSTREWFLVLLLVIGAQYILSNWTTGYGNDPNVLNYVSFAGTIVSIILAVLAIVYAFFQTFSQERSSNDIATQVDLLRRIVEDVRVSKNDFVGELERIDEIRAKMDESLQLNRASHDQVAVIGSRLESVSTYMQTLQSPSLESTSAGKPLSTEELRKLLDRIDIQAFRLLYWLHLTAGRELRSMNLLEVYADTLSADGSTPKWKRNVDIGMALGVAIVLIPLGVITGSDNGNQIKLAEDFSDVVAARAERELASGPEHAKETLSRLRSAANTLP